MEVTESRWFQFVVWPFSASLVYALMGWIIGPVHSSIGVLVATSILLGWIGGYVNTVLPKTKRIDDYLIFPLLTGGISVALALSLHSTFGCPWAAVLFSPMLFVAGYVAGFPAFGNTLATLFLDRVLPPPL